MKQINFAGLAWNPTDADVVPTSKASKAPSSLPQGLSQQESDSALQRPMKKKQQQQKKKNNTGTSFPMGADANMVQ